MDTVVAAPRFLRLKAVQERTGLPKPTIYNRIAKGTFPRPVSLGSPRAVAWLESEITSWILECVAQSARTRAAQP